MSFKGFDSISFYYKLIKILGTVVTKKTSVLSSVTKLIKEKWCKFLPPKYMFIHWQSSVFGQNGLLLIRFLNGMIQGHDTTTELVNIFILYGRFVVNSHSLVMEVL